MSTLSKRASNPKSSAAPSQTLNAAFLQEIKEDNERLRDLIRSAAQALSLPRHVRALDLIRTLNDLCDQLAMHFALENALGYLDNALEIAPRLSRRARALRSEHDALFEDFREIVEEAEKLIHHSHPRRQVTRVAVMFFDFQARFQAHEAHENELIFEAFDDDVGVGD